VVTAGSISAVGAVGDGPLRLIRSADKC
jgi:hypothetical protein